MFFRLFYIIRLGGRRCLELSFLLVLCAVQTVIMRGIMTSLEQNNGVN